MLCCWSAVIAGLLGVLGLARAVCVLHVDVGFTTIVIIAAMSLDQAEHCRRVL